MRLPNGFGSVIKMKGRRRNPYIVRKTAGWHYDEEKDRQVQDYIVIGYAKTKAEGLQMLAEYNKRPYDIQSAKMTFQEVYGLWSKQKYQSISHSNVNGYTAAYKVCTSIYNKSFSSLKLADLQGVIDSCGKNYPTMKKIKNLFSQLYMFAVKNDICSKNYAPFVDIAQYRDRNPNKRERNRIPKPDIDRIWEQKDDPYYQIILMLIYNGCRVSEFLNLKKEDVHIAERYFEVRKAKTENGLRIVPIADKVLPFYKAWYERCPECEYLIHTPAGSHFAYRNYYDSYFTALMDQMNMPYTPHFTRHTTASMMADAGIDPGIQKKILGHSGAMTLTERVYTHLDIQTLIDAINKI